MSGTWPDGLRIAGYEPGAIGAVCALHATCYEALWGVGGIVEARVAADMGAFFARFDPQRDLFVAAWQGDRLAGSITLDGGGPGSGRARLHWFIVADDMQGRGLGRRLLGEAMSFAKERGYRSVWLTTTAGLDAAHRLYRAQGFRLVHEESGSQWGRVLTERVMEADL